MRGKYYASEICNQVTFDAISVMGGSGFMRDYPLERHYRDARITNIYEGTSQLQVLAAIRGVTSGIAEKYFTRLVDSGVGAQWPELLEKLTEARAMMAECVAKYKTSGTAYQDLISRKLVDIATDIMIGYLFCRQAAHSDDKLKVATRWLGEATARIRMNRELVLAGDTSSIDQFDALAGPPPAVE